MPPPPVPGQRPSAGIPFRIGIVGGPMAGVYLQQLIIEATAAAGDQDHVRVVCFPNPHGPERMQSQVTRQPSQGE
ncbi:MAG TPA: hypothetical protein VK911_01780 [Vicinamibacterales bacterium]|nr:hypothetical protein [Vicinamibacterales bacterium]